MISDRSDAHGGKQVFISLASWKSCRQWLRIKFSGNRFLEGCRRSKPQSMTAFFIPIQRSPASGLKLTVKCCNSSDVHPAGLIAAALPSAREVLLWSSLDGQPDSRSDRLLMPLPIRRKKQVCFVKKISGSPLQSRFRLYCIAAAPERNSIGFSVMWTGCREPDLRGVPGKDAASASGGLRMRWISAYRV